MKKVLLLLFFSLLAFGCICGSMDTEPESDSPTSEENYDYISDDSVSDFGCDYDNPACDLGYECVNNACIKQSCPESCEDNNSCTRGYCSGETNYSCTYEMLVGEQENCSGDAGLCSHFICSDGECINESITNCCGNGECETNESYWICPEDCEDPLEYDPDFSYPQPEPLDFEDVPKIYPENYGNNYFKPGTYPVHVGDGFGKGDFLIKFVDFVVNEEYGVGYATYEVFKKEADGHYYHYPTDDNTFFYYSYNEPFGIPVGMPSYGFEEGTDELMITYYPDCTSFFEICEDPENDHWGYGEWDDCSRRCMFEAYGDNEIKLEKGEYSVVLPSEFEEVDDILLEEIEQCWVNTVNFMGYDPEKPRIGLKVRLDEEDPSGPTGHDEGMTAETTSYWLDFWEPDGMRKDLEERPCPNHLVLAHELAHMISKEMLGDNYGLNEGLATYVQYANGGAGNMTMSCEEDEDFYVPLSTRPSESNYPPDNYYDTGACFWKEFADTYGHGNFTKAMRALYLKSRGIEDYYVLDVLEESLGEPVSQDILDKYGLDRESTHVILCENCEMFLVK